MIDDGDRLMVYISTIGTHKGSLMGLPPTGRTFRVNQVDISRFNSEGTVTEHWGVFDTFGMMAQLGLLPSPAASPKN